MTRFLRSTLLVPLVILLSALAGGIYGGRVKAVSPNAEDDTLESMRVLTKVYATLEDNYADPVDPGKAIYSGAIPGALRTLDPHTNFFDPKQYALLRDDQKGRYFGVGMTVAPRNNKTIVLSPFAGSPAFKAGLRPGDTILRVDDRPTDNLSTTEVADLLKGPKGTTVRILIQRMEGMKPLEFTITRGEIPRDSVEQAFDIQPGIGYIKLTAFNETTTRELQEALRKLEVRSLKGLVLDLRGNPGGLLTEGVNVADMFLSKGQVIVSHRGRASREKVIPAKNGNGGLEYPLVVLIDRRSASASEIVAGAIQDHDRGLIVGETSFGKGLVQTVYPLAGDTGLALTTAYFYTPSGRLIQRKYDGLSLYDYYYLREDAAPKDASGKPLNRQTERTDSGRIVYGGGGITPDVKVEAPKLAGLMRTLAQKYGTYGPQQYWVFIDFARYYLSRHDTIARDFEVDGRVMVDFRAFLDGDHVPYTEAELRQDEETLKRGIKQNLFMAVFGKNEGDRISITHDPVVLKAVEVIPQAGQLAQNAHRLIAQRGATE